MLLFHGAPGSRLFRPGGDALDGLGVRLLSFDRPGYGESTADDARTVLSTAHDAECLIDHLAIDRVAVIGWSGGCPFAAAAAVVLGPRVTGLALVAGPGPLDEVAGAWEALGEYRRPTAEMARVDPARSVRAIARDAERYLADPESFLGRGRGPDGPVLRGPDRPMLVAQIREAFRQQAAGISADLVAMWLPFGFALADVGVPAAVFHGELDRDNREASATYAERIAGSTLTWWPDGGHLAVLPRWREVVERVLR